MKFLLPTGIGDTTWALTKAKAIAERLGDGKVEIGITCHREDVVETRSLEYVRRFPFVTSADMVQTGAILKSGDATDKKGRYRYIDDGDTTFAPPWYALIPNAPLERGERLETWFPDDPIDWTITNQWQNTDVEKRQVADITSRIGDYAIIYPGPEAGNTHEGHNRGGLWTPKQWVEIAQRIRAMGLTPVAIGASYDWSFWRHHIAHELKRVDPTMKLVYPFIGTLKIGQTLAVIRGSKFGIYYQSGLGVWSAYESKPTAMFWRPDGDSIHPHRLLSFDERMATAWVPPEELKAQRYLPCIYGRVSVDSIMEWAAKQI